MSDPFTNAISMVQASNAQDLRNVTTLANMKLAQQQIEQQKKAYDDERRVINGVQGVSGFAGADIIDMKDSTRISDERWDKNAFDADGNVSPQLQRALLQSANAQGWVQNGHEAVSVVRNNDNTYSIRTRKKLEDGKYEYGVITQDGQSSDDSVVVRFSPEQLKKLTQFTYTLSLNDSQANQALYAANKQLVETAGAPNEPDFGALISKITHLTSPNPKMQRSWMQMMIDADSDEEAHEIAKKVGITMGLLPDPAQGGEGAPQQPAGQVEEGTAPQPATQTAPVDIDSKIKQLESELKQATSPQERDSLQAQLLELQSAKRQKDLRPEFERLMAEEKSRPGGFQSIEEVVAERKRLMTKLERGNSRERYAAIAQLKALDKNTKELEDTYKEMRESGQVGAPGPNQEQPGAETPTGASVEAPPNAVAQLGEAQSAEEVQALLESGQLKLTEQDISQIRAMAHSQLGDQPTMEKFTRMPQKDQLLIYASIAMFDPTQAGAIRTYIDNALETGYGGMTRNNVISGQISQANLALDAARIEESKLDRLERRSTGVNAASAKSIQDGITSAQEFADQLWKDMWSVDADGSPPKGLFDKDGNLTQSMEKVYSSGKQLLPPLEDRLRQVQSLQEMEILGRATNKYVSVLAQAAINSLDTSIWDDIANFFKLEEDVSVSDIGLDYIIGVETDQNGNPTAFTYQKKGSGKVGRTELTAREAEKIDSFFLNVITQREKLRRQTQLKAEELGAE